MSFTPNLAEQTMFADRKRSARQRLNRAEWQVELGFTLGFLVACVWLARAAPPQPVHVLPVIVSAVVFVIASRVRFELSSGFTVAAQLGFVPLLFALPLAAIAPACVVCTVLSYLPDIVVDGLSVGRRLVKSITNSWFVIGPAAVLVIAGTPARDAGFGLLCLALIAQILVDAAVSMLRELLHGGRHSVGPLMHEGWVYLVDAALASIGLLAALGLDRSPFAPLALAPLLWLLGTFAHERSHRLEGLIELNETYRGTARVLSKVIDADDAYTGQHCRSVVDLCLAVARSMRLDATTTRNLEFAALLHDVGKIDIPDAILNKAGSLDPDEWAIMKTHTIAGQKLLDTVGGFMHDVGLIVRAHHERFDGAGYPDGLAGKEIPIEARIIAACDTWNAMRTNRVYREALSFDAAHAELLRVSGTQLDPEIVATLLSVLRRPADAGGSVKFLYAAA